MASEDRFKQAIINTLAKRAANVCSNPDCQAITSGPSAIALESVNVGEAAHIYGANPGSARYAPDMTSADRSSISNAIWVCGNCHKIIDDDPIRFPAGLLFEWQRAHEAHISERIGKAGAEARKRYEVRHLEEFGRLSYLSERLITEKDALWEYRLTSEVLRFETAPILQRWDALKKGLYTQPITKIDRENFVPWFISRLAEAAGIVNSMATLVNDELKLAWGEPGVPGNDIAIVATARLLAEACRASLVWEETVRFVASDEIFDEVRQLLSGTAGRIIDQVRRIPEFLSQDFVDGEATGSFKLDLVISLSEGWHDQIDAAMERVRNKLRNDM
jgi:hypothetical protein